MVPEYLILDNQTKNSKEKLNDQSNQQMGSSSTLIVGEASDR